MFLIYNRLYSILDILIGLTRFTPKENLYLILSYMFCIGFVCLFFNHLLSTFNDCITRRRLRSPGLHKLKNINAGIKILGFKHNPSVAVNANVR